MNHADTEGTEEGALSDAPRGDDLSGRFIAAAIEVHRALGPGYLESVYEEAMVIELGLRGIPWFDPS
jgi:hypothetical protein